MRGAQGAAAAAVAPPPDTHADTRTPPPPGRSHPPGGGLSQPLRTPGWATSLLPRATRPRRSYPPSPPCPGPEARERPLKGAAGLGGNLAPPPEPAGDRQPSGQPPASARRRAVSLGPQPPAATWLRGAATPIGCRPARLLPSYIQNGRPAPPIALQGRGCSPPPRAPPLGPPSRGPPRGGGGSAGPVPAGAGAAACGWAGGWPARPAAEVWVRCG